MMPPPLHFSDICCKCFPYQLAYSKQKGAKNERTNECVYVACWKTVYSVSMKKVEWNSKYIYMKSVNEIFKLTCETVSTIASVLLCPVNLWIHSPGVSSCTTSWQNCLMWLQNILPYPARLSLFQLHLICLW